MADLVAPTRFVACILILEVQHGGRRKQVRADDARGAVAASSPSRRCSWRLQHRGASAARAHCGPPVRRARTRQFEVAARLLFRSNDRLLLPES